MLVDKYLPVHDFKEFHAIKVNTPVNDVYGKMLLCDISKNYPMRFFAKWRGMQSQFQVNGFLSEMGFIVLEEQPGKEIVYGMIATSHTFNCCQSGLSPASFIASRDASIIKAVINFRLQQQEGTVYIISTETRIWCGSSEMRKKFRLYWFFVKPFSQFLRKAVLQEIRRQILKPGNA